MLFSFFVPVLVFIGFLAFSLPRPVDCSECGTRLSIWVNPFRKSRRMWCEGGFLCPNCDCETDLQGRKVAAGTLPRPGAMRRYGLMWAFTGAYTIGIFTLSAAMPWIMGTFLPVPIAAPPIRLPLPTTTQASPALPPPIVRVDR